MTGLRIERTPERESRIADFMEGEREAIAAAFGAEHWPEVRDWIESLPWMAEVDQAQAIVIDHFMRDEDRELEPEEAALLVAARRTMHSLTESENVEAVADRMGVRFAEAEKWVEAVRAQPEEEAPVDDGSRCALYRHFDSDGVLVYVGISHRPDLREEQHRARSPWWRFVDRSAIEWFVSRRLAEAAERKAIRQEEPVFNRTHSRNRNAVSDYLFRALERAS